MHEQTPEELRARELLSQLSKELGLPDESQDWGIVNADAERLEEFVAFLDSREFAPTQVWELVELIAASANERLLRDPDADVRAVWRVIERYPAAGRFHYEYWAGLENASEFPLSVWLRDQTPY